MNTKLLFDPSFDYLPHKLKLIIELKELEDRIIRKESDYFKYLKEELEKDLWQVNEIINEHYHIK